jgi:hypothetical protein
MSIALSLWVDCKNQQDWYSYFWTSGYLITEGSESSMNAVNFISISMENLEFYISKIK